MNHPAVTALIPVVLFIVIGYMAGRLRWIGAGSVKDLSNLVFMVLAPALLFRTMASVHVQDLNFRPILMYFLAASVVFAAVLLVKGFNRTGAVLALAGTFSNTVMIGVPLVGLAFGERGLVMLFTLVSVHALVLLSAATIVLEVALLREEARHGRAPERHMAGTVALAVRNGILHPVPLPIIAGLLFAQTGWSIPGLIDKPLMLLGQALGPLSLVLVGVTLAFGSVGTHLRGALGLAMVKNLAFPVSVWAMGRLFGMQGTDLAVMVMTAALPIGANVFLFSQRYGVAQGVVTASVAVTTFAGLVTLPLWLWAVSGL